MIRVLSLVAFLLAPAPTAPAPAAAPAPTTSPVGETRINIGGGSRETFEIIMLRGELLRLAHMSTPELVYQNPSVEEIEKRERESKVYQNAMMSLAIYAPPQIGNNWRVVLHEPSGKRRTLPKKTYNALWYRENKNRGRLVQKFARKVRRQGFGPWPKGKKLRVFELVFSTKYQILGSPEPEDKFTAVLVALPANWSLKNVHIVSSESLASIGSQYENLQEGNVLPE